MTIEGGLFDRINAVATSVNGRIYRHKLPQAPDLTLPAITYQRVSNVPVDAFTVSGPLVTARFRVNIWGTTHAEAMTTAREVESGLDRYAGTVDGTVVQQVMRETALDLYEDDTGTYRIVQDYMVFFEE